VAEFENRAEHRREFYQLVGSLSADAALVQNSEATDEIADRCLQYGAWNAQGYLIEVGGGDRWYKVSPADTVPLAKEALLQARD